MRSLRGVHRSAWLLTLAAAIVPWSAWSAEEKFTIDIYKKEAQKIATGIGQSQAQLFHAMNPGLVGEKIAAAIRHLQEPS